ncbi:hypothetical protein QAD02_000199 [Eretmocerus hayati]|uniref:Uncharacterized protein n=1 Tax=Eretmocerus hayati TaxID=131215 RepID=A0ACC2NH89_9HYME|nr:hypothetical protein QAD02_000199 [Eretmocerus hayati]
MLPFFLILCIFGSIFDIGSSSIQPSSRIRRFSGIHITTKNHPTVVRVTYRLQPICDGSLISDTLSLTAAHCIFGIWHERMFIVIKNRGAMSIHKVSNTEYHEDYRPSTNKNDVALIKLAAPISLNKKIQFVHLPYPGILWSDEWRVISYRYTKLKQSHHDAALVELTSNAFTSTRVCAMFFNRTPESMNGLFCAASRQLNDFSEEMTGGPAIFDNTQYQVGIILNVGSYIGDPVLYINVSMVYDWLKQKKEQLLTSSSANTAFYPLPEEELDYNANDRGGKIFNEREISTVAIVNATNGKLVCAGSLVALDMVLTTARCARKGYECMRLRLPSNESSIERKFIKLYVHPDFSETSPEHDVALLKFRTEPDNDALPKIVVADSDQKLIHQSGYVHSFVGGSDLRRIESSVIDTEECDWLFKKPGSAPKGTICAKSPHGLCKRVAGEPLIIEGRLSGILTATPHDCGDPRYPGVYIRMDTNFKWIQQRITYLAEREEGL